MKKQIEIQEREKKSNAEDLDEASQNNTEAKIIKTEGLEEQYDANKDFAIFQPSEGGHLTLKEKMNIADAGGLPEI